MEPTIRKISIISQKEHAKRTSAWTGSKKRQTMTMYIIRGNRMNMENIQFTPTLGIIIDEIIVNACDHWTIYPHLVKNIAIELKENGEISVFNDGPGIFITREKNLAGVEMYSPQMIATEFHAGDNFTNGKITGGANGAGLKLTNSHSEYLILETIDETSKIHYIQEFKNGFDIIGQPKMVKTKKKSFTKITFMPSYNELGYTNFGADDYTDLYGIIKSRAYQICAYTQAKIHFNGEILMEGVPIRSRFSNLVGMFLSAETLFYTIGTDFPFEIAIGLSDGKFRQFSIINGVCADKGGNHIKHLQAIIVAGVRPYVEKLLNKTKHKFNPNFITNNLFILVKGSIPDPEWGGGNIKSHIDDPMEKFAEYKFSSGEIKEIWGLLEAPITSQFLNKVSTTRKKVIRSKLNIKKCEEAFYAGDRIKWKQCSLIICEGDSAEGTISAALTSDKTNLDIDYYGTFNIQGVPINARKQIAKIVVPGSGRTKIIRRNKLMNNERFSSLVTILGLDFEKTYETEEEFATLRYGRIIAATDQDEDGKGQIFGLIANFFELFWPNLVDRDYIRRLNTPIVRVIPKFKKGETLEFYLEHDYLNWVHNNGGMELVNSRYKSRYFKGLGTHEPKEAYKLFQGANKKILIFNLDEKANEAMEIYFGEDSSNRKHALATPVIYREIKSNRMDLSEALHTDTKSFQQDNNKRKLPHVFDGLVPSKRKILYHAIMEFSKKNDRIRANKFIADVASKMNYHHGEESLIKTMVKMAQCFKGAKNFPYLYPAGQYGTLKNGGKDYASGRYIYTYLNRKFCSQLFPRVDEALLPFTYDESKKSEPLYFVPIIPMAILETIEQPASGFKIKIWARDVWDVIDNVENMINGESCRDEIKILNTGGDLRHDEKGNLYSFGKYSFSRKSAMLTITELPIGKFPPHICGEDGEKRMRPEFTEPIMNRTSDEKISIIVRFKREAISEIMEKYGKSWCDPFEDYLGLKNSLDENLTMYNKDGYIVEYKCHSDIIREWFAERKALYGERIEREIIISRLKILRLENIIRFIDNHLTYKISSGMSIEVVNEILEKNKYVKFNSSAFDDIKTIATRNLENAILRQYCEVEANYNYLIGLRYWDFLDKSKSAKIDKLQKEHDKLNDLLNDTGKPFTGARTWRKELEILKKTIRDGILEEID